jgi:hypothetical protein
MHKTLTGVELKYVVKHKEILLRRLSYLEERYMLRQNSFDGAEIQALKHCIWLLTLEEDDGILLSDESSRKTDRSGNSKLAEPERILGTQEPNKSRNVIVRKVPKDSGQV